MLIDYIFVSSPASHPVVITHYGVLSDCLENEFPPSDHRPIVADIQIGN